MNDDGPRMTELFGGDPEAGFLDLPLGAPDDGTRPDIVVFGAPAATPYASVGNYCDTAPAAIRNAFGWPGVAEHHDFDLGGPLLPDGVTATDWGDVVHSDADFEANRDAIRARTAAVLAGGAVPLVLGGDDSIPIPVLQGFAEHGPITVLQLDAHIDWRDEVQGERLGLSSNMRRASELPWVEAIVQVGSRGVGSARPQDQRDAIDWGVHFFPMREVRRHGLAAVVDAIPAGVDVHIALDIDVMDPAVVPAVIGPAPGGFDYWEVINLLEAVADRARIVGFNLAELMPAADVGGRGALVASRITATVLGLVARQRRRA